MPTVGSTARIQASSSDVANLLWAEIVSECTRRGLPIRNTTAGDGYLWNGNLKQIGDKVGVTDKKVLDEVKKSLAASKNVTWVAERGQYYVAPIFKEVRRGAKVSLAPISEAQTILARSQRVWERARDYAKKHPEECTQEVHEGQCFWVVKKPLSYFMNAVFPELVKKPYETDRRPIYDFLRSTANAVNVGQKHDDELTAEGHRWVIRDQWNITASPIAFRRPKAPDAIDQRAAKLTPEEAGETREPAPVETRQGTPKSPVKKENSVSTPLPTPPVGAHAAPHPNTPTTPTTAVKLPSGKYQCPSCEKQFDTSQQVNGHRTAKHRLVQGQTGTGGPYQGIQGFITLPNGKIQCDECTQVYDSAASIPGHKKVHINENREKEMEKLHREIKRLRQIRSSTASTIEMDRIRAIDILTSMVETQDDTDRTITELKDTVDTLIRERDDALQSLQSLQGKTTIDGEVGALLGLIDEVFSSMYAGKIGMARAMGDIEDAMRSFKK